MNLNYCDHLWLGFDIIQRHFNEERNKLKSLLYIISEKKNCEHEYADNLERLYSFYETIVKTNKDNPNNKSPSSSLDDSINFMMVEMKKESDVHFDNVKEIEEKIIKELNEVLETQIENAFTLNESIKNYPKNFAEIIKNLEIERLSYNKVAKMAEVFTSDLEKLKAGGEKTTKKIAEEKRKQSDCFKVVKEHEKRYIDFIKEANEEREKFIKKTSEILSAYQEMDSKIIEIMQVKLLKIADIQFNLNSKVKISIEEQKKKFTEISIENDMNSFIEQNQTIYQPPQPYTFIPYQSDIKNMLDMNDEFQNNINKKTLAILNKKLLNSFSESQDPKENKELEFIEGIVKNMWEGKEIEMNHFNTLLEETKYRTKFLNCINNYRIIGLFSLKQKTYEYFSSGMNILLEKSEKAKDYGNIKGCLILSQTFSLRDGKLLQEEIQSNPIWQKDSTWEEVIKLSIKEEASNQNGYLIYFSETEEMRKDKARTTAFANLLTYWFNMKAFGFPIEKAKCIIEQFGLQYKIDTNDIYKGDFTNHDISENMLKASQEETLICPELKK